MSARALNWSWERMPQVPGTPTKLVLVALADRADDAGVCWPSYRTLADKLDVKPHTIARAVDRLDDAGLLTRKRQRRDDGTLGVYRYHLALDGVPGDQVPLLPPGASASTKKPREPVHSSPGAETTSRDVSSPTGDAHSLVGFFVDEARRLGGRPPRAVIGHVAREVGRLVAEGYKNEEVRPALTRLAKKGLSPTTLPSLVLEAQVRSPKATEEGERVYTRT